MWCPSGRTARGAIKGGGKNSDCRQESALLLTRFSKDRTGEAGALGSLGEAYRLVGYYDRSIQYLESAEKIAPKGFDF